MRTAVCVEVNYFLKAAIVSLTNQSRVDHANAASGALVGLTGVEVQVDNVFCSSTKVDQILDGDEVRNTESQGRSNGLVNQ